MRTGRLTLLALLSTVAVACGGGGSDGPGAGPPPPPPPPPFTPVVDLRGDANRDGLVRLDDPADDAGEGAWTSAAGPIVLANLDDDLERCGTSMLDGPEFSDEALAACNDAQDEVVNGPADLLDLARLKVAAWAAAPDDAVGTLTVTPPARGRLFRKVGDAYQVLASGAELSPAALRAGLDLAIEATDVVRDAAVWDGRIDVVLRVQRRGAPSTAVEDRVQLRVAPLILSHHLQPAQTLLVSDIGDDPASLDFRAALDQVNALAGIAAPVGALPTAPFRDRWMQDFLEDAHASMPAPGGPQVMRVVLRSPFLEVPDAAWTPLRRASRVAYQLRGRDVAVVQQFQRDHPLDMRTLDSMGNTEVVPPHVHAGVAHPFGRIVRGSTPAFHPDPSFSRMLEAQGVQAPIAIDTSWLFVGHVDETIAFVASTTAPRGWVALVADPPLARAMLQELADAGHGGATLFTGLADRAGAPAERTVTQVLADAGLAAASATATQRIAEQVAVLRAEVGLQDAEIVRVPVLFAEHTSGRLAAWLTNTVNLLAPVPGLVAVPAPHGPVVGGVDPFRAQLEAALAPHGVEVAWVDTWSFLHVFVGEIHCATNALRQPPALPWWGQGS